MLHFVSVEMKIRFDFLPSWKFKMIRSQRNKRVDQIRNSEFLLL